MAGSSRCLLCGHSTAKRALLSASSGESLVTLINSTRSASYRFIPDAPPSGSQVDISRVEPAPALNRRLIDHLESLSLVRFSNEDAVKHLRKAIAYANRLKLINVQEVTPMVSVLEDRNVPCPLRDDVVTNGDQEKQLLSMAAKTLDGYYVTPPGNVPLEQSSSNYTNDKNK